MQHFLHLVLSPNICFIRESNSQHIQTQESCSHQMLSLHEEIAVEDFKHISHSSSVTSAQSPTSIWIYVMEWWILRGWQQGSEGSVSSTSWPGHCPLTRLRFSTSVWYSPTVNPVRNDSLEGGEWENSSPHLLPHHHSFPPWSLLHCESRDQCSTQHYLRSIQSLRLSHQNISCHQTLVFCSSKQWPGP